MPKPPAQTFDPRSDRVALHYLGSDEGVPALVGIPARDLTEADLARLVYAKALTAYDGTDAGGPMPDPTAPDQDACRALATLLVERGVYSTAVPAPEPATTDTPAAPVEG